MPLITCYAKLNFHFSNLRPFCHDAAHIILHLTNTMALSIEIVPLLLVIRLPILLISKYMYRMIIVIYAEMYIYIDVLCLNKENRYRCRLTEY